MLQRTIKQKVIINGIGLHSGKAVELALCPATDNHGIVFQRKDMQSEPKIKANGLIVEEAFMCSNLVEGAVRISTVEHLMSALAALGIDNVLIEMSAEEVPILDGSALPFIEKIISSGIVSQKEYKKFIKILQPVEATIDDKVARLTPYETGFVLDFVIDFAHPVIKNSNQHYQYQLGSKTYVEQIAYARTFGLMKDLEQLKQNNLGLGAGLDNAIGLSDDAVLNPEGLRVSDEFVRHKILDAIGDLYLIGGPILARFDGYKSGHALNNMLLRHVLSDPTNYQIVTFCKKEEAPIDYQTAS